MIKKDYSGLADGAAGCTGSFPNYRILHVRSSSAEETE
ncbi:hypothetical protein M2169_001020 [Streptomyces sp. MJP52]|nr:hypothetical protein [Streptomyces sp. MJP52]